MINLILCGGVGSRLWPMSRALMPKQFYPLFNGFSLFEETVKRNQKLASQFYVAANKNQYFLAQEQLVRAGINQNKGLVEPVGRNTAPAIALCCFGLNPEELVLVTPSDHLITKIKEYHTAVKSAMDFALGGKLVTFGIKPSFAETGFGYIEFDGSVVKAFREKPDAKTAQAYVDSGRYLWNSGMFCFKAGVFLEELETYSPQVYKASKKAFDRAVKQQPLEVLMDDMQNIPSISIDYAVMEQSQKVSVVPCDIGWSDLGSFDSLYEETFNKALGNAVIGLDRPILLDSQNNLIIVQDKRVALVDVEDLIVVDSPDALLISKRGSSQKVKEVVAQLKAENSNLLEAPMTVKKPWGSYTVLQDTPGFKVKRLDVKPGARLSLQKHARRQEHWVVVHGEARVTVDSETKVFVRNQSVYIPLGSIHRLENAGQEVLTVVETQVGDYFGEDDIIRLEDDYNRK